MCPMLLLQGLGTKLSRYATALGHPNAKTPPGCPVRDSDETAGGRSEYATTQAAKITHLDKGLELCDALAAQL